MFFWWLLGRGIEALFAAKQSVMRPCITWAETIFAGILFIVGLVTLAGMLTSTPDDRRDLQFIALIAGGLLWGVLATATIAARLQQRRIQKLPTTPQPTVGPIPS
jgi:membrane associated rhomboid family serine protease